MSESQSAEDILRQLLDNPDGASLIDKLRQEKISQQEVRPTTKQMLNVKEGYVVPATKHNFNNPALQPFKGTVLPRNAEEGLAYLKAAANGGPDAGDAAIRKLRGPEPSLVTPGRAAAAAVPADDTVAGTVKLSEMTKPELIKFAKETYGYDLQPEDDIRTMRKEVKTLSEA
jgi:hypothetical protein